MGFFLVGVPSTPTKKGTLKKRTHLGMIVERCSGYSFPQFTATPGIPRSESSGCLDGMEMAQEGALAEFSIEGSPGVQPIDPYQGFHQKNG